MQFQSGIGGGLETGKRGMGCAIERTKPEHIVRHLAARVDQDGDGGMKTKGKVRRDDTEQIALSGACAPETISLDGALMRQMGRRIKGHAGHREAFRGISIVRTYIEHMMAFVKRPGITPLATMAEDCRRKAIPGQPPDHGFSIMPYRNYTSRADGGGGAGSCSSASRIRAFEQVSKRASNVLAKVFSSSPGGMGGKNSRTTLPG